ncbi:hypothetical protein AVEN_261806-1 [Araneus ventricosus]|uniref:Uncharacterized protein n=1 Tax=Araneus ventricosus TaxID=182803 RepID=A0A4Y2LZZ4_ARAVE|nr:hypothetical protein AVEN_261806-1 [Araneus ventricosus]
MEYPNLIQYTLACPVLKKTIHEMAVGSGTLNLVHPDWESRLHEYSVHRRHLKKEVAFSKGRACRQDKAHVRNISIPSNAYKVIVLGKLSCSRSKSQELDGPPGDIHFVARECPPLTRIAEAMKDSPSQKLHDGAILFMEHCDPALCNQCLTAHTQRRVPWDRRRNWCVLKTRKFNGMKLEHDFKTKLVPVLEGLGSFYAIAQLNIFSRTTFGEDTFKIGGKIKDLIVFQESAILPRVEEIVFSERSTIPSIEFPEEENGDEEELENIH